ncbi:hypothetical protein [Antarcticimicrobium luteum]|uniref:Uncharacterized protein n=1 Tax=Antarcticimicrobium luteum TaxID=2547397 RepID=A0A4R5VEP9_9RHOB|nr:hypothetical protein [Antarcticimicrobium luteum]TDK50899.1 hypothetical protein E1832_04980 [Antarcticimicrobium luteum]
MLIVTTDALPGDLNHSVGDLPEKTSWRGLKALVILPDAGVSRDTAETLSKDFFIIEHLQRPAGSSDILCDALGWLRMAWRQADGPLLYLDRPFDAAELEAQADRGWTRVHDVEADLSADGRLGLLRLGRMVATSPLLPEFIEFMTGRAVGDAMFVDLLRDTFVWDDNA